jgi:hypothetical protein
MLKFSLLLIFIVLSIESNCQKLECNCDEREIIPENQYKCEVINFTNGAKLYWQWNCDSAWLTFERSRKSILKSCINEDVYSCDRIGLVFLKEYPRYLLFEHRWISGCCTPPDLVFLRKEDASELKRIKNSQFVWGDVDENYALFFSDSTYKKLIYLNHISDKEYSIQFLEGQVNNSAKTNHVLDQATLFKDFVKNESSFTFYFKTEKRVWDKMKIEFK